jgi:hypothetical protein
MAYNRTKRELKSVAQKIAAILAACRATRQRPWLLLLTYISVE